VDIPAYELDTFVLTATEAVDLAAAGEIQNGFRCLAGGAGEGLSHDVTKATRRELAGSQSMASSS
jgi:hypothetical protein